MKYTYFPQEKMISFDFPPFPFLITVMIIIINVSIFEKMMHTGVLKTSVRNTTTNYPGGGDSKIKRTG